MDALVLLGAQVLDARQGDFAVAAVGAAGLLLYGVEGVVTACGCVYVREREVSELGLGVVIACVCVEYM